MESNTKHNKFTNLELEIRIHTTLKITMKKLTKGAIFANTERLYSDNLVVLKKVRNEK